MGRKKVSYLKAVMKGEELVKEANRLVVNKRQREGIREFLLWLPAVKSQVSSLSKHMLEASKEETGREGQTDTHRAKEVILKQ